MEVRNNSNVNFNGRLNVKAMQTEIPYWKNVAAILESKTADCLKDIFKLSEDADGIALETTRKGSDRTHLFFWENPADLLKYSEDVLSGCFAELMRALNKEGEIYEATDAYLKKIKPVMDKVEFEKFEEEVWDNAVDVSFQTTKFVDNEEPFCHAVWDE